MMALTTNAITWMDAPLMLTTAISMTLTVYAPLIPLSMTVALLGALGKMMMIAQETSCSIAVMAW
jgi:hypothetical protein